MPQDRVGGSKFFMGSTTNKKNEILPNVEEFGNFYSINPQKMAPPPLPQDVTKTDFIYL